MTDSLVIAVDGPAGSGKSSAARGVARILGLRYLDTGAMYRAATWWMLGQGVDIGDPAAVAGSISRPVIEVGTDPAAPVIRVDGMDVTAQIRTRAVSNAVSAIAPLPAVRAHLIARQREVIAAARGGGDGIVAEGRDIGSVVAPQAALKVFLTASEEVRAGRRAKDLADDPAATAAVTRGELNRRDSVDAPQTVMAADAVQIDSTTRSLDEVIGLIVELARGRAGLAGGDAGAGNAGAGSAGGAVGSRLMPRG